MATMRDMALADMLHRIAPDIVAGRKAMLANGDARDVHRLRQALRRVRAVLRLMLRETPSLRLADLRHGAHAMAEALAPLRAWDVFLAETLLLARRHGLDAVLADRLAVAGTRARAAELHLARTALRGPAMRNLARHLATIATSTPALPPAVAEPRVADAIMAGLHRRIRKRGRRFRAHDAAARHRLRLAGKALTDVAGLLDPPHRITRRGLGRLARLTTMIGAERDRQSALALARQIADPLSGIALASALDRAGHGQERAMRRQWRAFRRAPKPRLKRGRGHGASHGNAL